MPLEKPTYRDHLELIFSEYPGKRMLNISEVSKFIGRDRKTVKKLFDFENGYISVVKLARQMS